MSGAGLAALALATGGCANALKISGGGTMSGYVAPKLKRIRVGVGGVGARGTYALKRLAFMPGVEIAAFCDIKEDAMKRCRDYLAEKKFRPAREFLGPEAYKDLCQWDGVDVVYACVPWKLHAPVALAAMRADKHAFVEVRPVSGRQGRGRRADAWTPRRPGAKAIWRLPSSRGARRNARPR